MARVRLALASVLLAAAAVLLGHGVAAGQAAWTAIAPLPDGRSHFEGSTIVYGGRIIVVSGRCNASQPPRMNVDDMLEYDPGADAWRVLGTNPLRVMAPSAEIVGGKLVVIGGGIGMPLPLTADAYVAEVPKR